MRPARRPSLRPPTRWLVLLLAIGALTLGCSDRSTEETEAVTAEQSESEVDAGPQLRVGVVSAPLRSFVERIGGDVVEVVFPIPPGVDPALWSPDTEAVLRYQEADLVLRSGADYAKWLDRVTLRGDRVVDTAESYVQEMIPLEDQVTHSHGPSGEHSHEGLASVTWLDLDLAQRQVAAVAEALAAARPEREQEFRERARKLSAELEALDVRLEKAVWRLEADEPVAYSQPVYQYFERRYGLDGEALHWDADAEPDAEDWKELGQVFSEGSRRWMFWHVRPSDEVLEALANRQVDIVIVDPVAEDEDFLRVMEANVAAVEAAAAQVEPPG